jgi:hypothetical protein
MRIWRSSATSPSQAKANGGNSPHGVFDVDVESTPSAGQTVSIVGGMKGCNLISWYTRASLIIIIIIPYS